MLSLAKNSTSAVRVSRRAWEHRIHEESTGKKAGTYIFAFVSDTDFEPISDEVIVLQKIEKLRCKPHRKKSTFNVGNDFPLSFSLASLSTVEPFRSYFLCTWSKKSLIQLMKVYVQCMIYLQVGAEDISDDHQVGLNVVYGESKHCQVLRQQGLGVAVDDVGVVLLEQAVHLLHLLGGEGLDHVHPVGGEVEVCRTVALRKKSTTSISAAAVVCGCGRSLFWTELRKNLYRVDGFRALAQGVEEVEVIDTKPDDGRI